MVYYIGCQDCSMIGKIDAQHWFFNRTKPCPTCKGETLVPEGTKFTGGYPQAHWLKYQRTIKHPDAVLDTRNSTSAMCSVNRDRSADIGAPDDRREGPGLGTLVIAAAIISNSSQDNSDQQ